MLVPPHSSHIPMSLDGVEIIVNGSGSYTEIRKGYVCRDLIMSATARSGGCYLFANHRGCDGEAASVFTADHYK